MIKLYGFEASGNCYKIRLLLSLLGIEYENIIINVKSGDNKTAEFLQMNPHGLVPVIIDGDDVVYDSAAILVYLARKHADPCWLPTDPVAMAQVVRWLAFEQSEGRYGLARARAMVLNMPSPLAKMGTLEEAQGVGRQALGMLEEQLAHQQWLAGEGEPTVADIACYPYTAMAEQGGLSLEPYPSVNRWMTAIKQLEGYVALP